MNTTKKTIRIRARLTDLWWDEGGWSENGATVTEKEFTLPEGLTDRQIACRIRKKLGLGPEFRIDFWCGADWCWRYGSMGAYADIVENIEGDK